MHIVRNRPLVTIGVAESVSGCGSWVTMLAVFALVVFRGQGGVAQSSAVFLAGLLPTLIASPAAGWLCDRYDRKRLMIASELLDGLVVAGLIFARRTEMIYALVALQAVIVSVMAPARQAAIPAIVPPEELTMANAFLQQLASIVKIAAPILAGLVLAAVGPHAAIVLDVVSFLLSALILTRLPALPPDRARAGQREFGTKADLKTDDYRAPGAWQTAWSSARLRLLFIAMFLTIMVIVGFDVLSSVVTRDVLRGNETLFGLLIGLVGLGSAIAAAYLLLQRGQRDPWQDLLLGMAFLACLPASLALAGLSGDPRAARVVAGAGCLIGGLGNGLAAVQVSTLLQRCSPPNVLGQVSGLFQSTSVAGQMVGILVTPLLVPVMLSAGQYFAVATIALLALVLYLSRVLRGTRQVAGAHP